MIPVFHTKKLIQYGDIADIAADYPEIHENLESTVCAESKISECLTW
jgi:hypothetical protein